MHHFHHSWRHRTFDPNFWQTRFQNFDPLDSSHFDRFQFHRGRMIYYRGPSRVLWFAIGAFTATWYHRAHARGEFRGWGPCGNRRIEEWRAERAAEAAMREQFPTNANQQKKNEWSWRPDTPPSLEDEEARRRWGEKTKAAQETVADLSESALDGILVAAESLKARLAEFRQSQRQEQERRTPPEESKSRHVV